MAEMIPEVWRPTPFPNYEVSNLGNVRRATTGRRTHPGKVLRPALLRMGYLGVAPSINGKNVTHYVHVLVAEAFVPKVAGATSVNHKDGVKQNNHAENLEWMTQADNVRHAMQMGLAPSGHRHYRAKFTPEMLTAIKADRASGLSYSQLAAKYGVSIGTAHAAVNGQTYASEGA